MISPRRRIIVRRLLIGTLAGLATLLAADTAAWLFATGWLERELATWLTQRRAAGWTASTSQPVRAGWPLAAVLKLTDVALAGGEADLPGGLAWEAGAAELSISLPRPFRLSIKAAGRQRLRLATLPVFPLTAERLELVLPLGSGPASWAADLSAARLHAAFPTGILAIAGLALHADGRREAAAGEAAISANGHAEAIDLPLLPSGHPWPPGPRIATAAFDAALTGPLPPAGSLPRRAVAWRDGGGSLLVRQLTVGWGKLALSATATMALDPHLQPAGAATMSLAGYEPALDALAASNPPAARVVKAVKGVLAILARPAQGGSGAQVELPVNLEDRTLTVGPFPLLRLPELVWP